MRSGFMPGPSLLNTKVPIRVFCNGYNMTSTQLLRISNKYQTCANRVDTTGNELNPAERHYVFSTFSKKKGDKLGAEKMC